MVTPPQVHSLAGTDFLSGAEWSRATLELVLHTAASLKKSWQPTDRPFTGRAMAMLFERPSLRTRVSFEVGFARLGGYPVYLDQQAARIGERESISDCAKNLERYADVIVARTKSHDTIEELAAHASVPVVNALSDRFHPCQALADVLTIRERFPRRSWDSIKLAYIGDGNNVCHSLLLVSAILGMRITVIAPTGFEPDMKIVAQARALDERRQSIITITHRLDAIADHDVVYTDTWVSMGNESEAAKRACAFSHCQVTPKLMTEAAANAIFMHCLPAYRGKEVAAEVIDGPQSVVFDQAENRMHAQNALLLHLIAPFEQATRSIQRPADTFADAVTRFIPRSPARPKGSHT